MAFAHRSAPADAMARGLGWFSLALGVTELVAGRRLARWMGMEEDAGLIRAYGAREVAQGLGLLALGDRRPWMWGRVAGDAVDLATLSRGLHPHNPRRQNVAIAMGAVAAVTMADMLCTGWLQRQETRVPMRHPDYSRRSGLPRPPEQMRGAARDAPVPDDMRTPAALRPWSSPDFGGQPRMS